MSAGSSVAILHAVSCLAVLQTAAAIITQKEPFGLKESVSGEYDAETEIGNWTIDVALLSTGEGTVSILHPRALHRKETHKLVPEEVYRVLGSNTTIPSDDESFVLIKYDERKDIGSVAVARFAVYSVEDGKIKRIHGGKLLQFVSWSSENALVYGYGNNIYYLSAPAAEPLQVTTDGEPHVIYNGVLLFYGDLSDYVPETAAAGSTVLWSDDETRFAFVRYNTSTISSIAVMRYDSADSEEDMSTSVVNYHNAKPGAPLPEVRLMVAILPSGNSTKVTIRELLPPEGVVGNDRYIGFVEWVDDKILMAEWTNRVRNISQMVTYDTSKRYKRIRGKKGLKLERKDGWVGFQDIVSKDGDYSSYLIIDWVPQPGAGSFRHVVKVTGTCRTPITSGKFTVTDIYGWDKSDLVYFQATQSGRPSRRHVYVTQEGGSPVCLSCDVITPEGNLCTRASAEFRDNFLWMFLTCHGPDPPFVLLRYTADLTGKGVTVQDNSELREKLSQKQLPRRLDDWVDLGDGMRAQVRMWLPPGLDPEGSEKRPAVVEVYATPDTQQVDDTFKVGVHSYFTTSRRYVYILIDGRGAGCRSDRMLFSVYRRLGTVEIQDQIDVTKKLAEKYRFIDSSRVAIWGWSHGGYSAAMAMARDEHRVFRCGVAVAPVTDWISDQALYVEQYMGLPEDNEAGYEDSAITPLAGRFANNSFLLIHGTADDNVPFKNSMRLSRALEEAGVLFRQQIYPDEDHSISQLDIHVFSTIDAFFYECFDEESPSRQIAQH